uniref:Uncharacterized protein n=1 Tax=Swordtail adomavirus 2 TaxID=2609877 RepID=A0A6F9EY59_9VIRU|nr:TPA_asm: hypothetical protein [Swordtail adomavirus 2]
MDDKARPTIPTSPQVLKDAIIVPLANEVIPVICDDLTAFITANAGLYTRCYSLEIVQDLIQTHVQGIVQAGIRSHFRKACNTLLNAHNVQTYQPQQQQNYFPQNPVVQPMQSYYQQMQDSDTVGPYTYMTPPNPPQFNEYPSTSGTYYSTMRQPSPQNMTQVSDPPPFDPRQDNVACSSPYGPLENEYEWPESPATNGGGKMRTVRVKQGVCVKNPVKDLLKK